MILDQSVQIGSLTIATGATVTITSDYTLTVTGSSVLGSNASLLLSYGSNTTGFILDLETLDLGCIIAKTTSGGRSVNVRINSTLTMSDVSTSYFDEWISVTLTDKNAIGSHVRFDGQLIFDSGDKRIPLGNHDLFLGENATISVPAVATGDPKGYIATSDDTVNVTGGICVHYGSLKTAQFEFPIGGAGSFDKFTPIRVKVTGETAGTTTSQTVPWPYVKVRAISHSHPMNTAQNQFRLYWSVKGYGTPDELGGSVCLAVEMYYHNNYRTGSPSDIYSACYVDNYEDDRLTSPAWEGIWDLEGSQYASSNLPAGSTTFQSNANYWLPMGPNSLNPSTPCVPHFGDFTVGLGTDPLPVELVSFSARWFDGAVRLSWQTATEINNFGFAIERSEDGELWKEVGFVPGHGNSSSPKFYQHQDVLEDEALHAPKLAYRLRQMDRDGTTDYSNIVFVHTGELPEGMSLYAAYPNPFNPATTISFAIGTPSNVTLKVYNALGQAVATLLAGSAMDAGLHTVPFDGATLPSGVYMAVLEADGAVQHQKLMLNK